MTIFKLPGTSIVSNTITTTQLVTTVVNQISQGGGPKVSGITYPNSATAAANTGSETVVLTGTGFESGVQIYINGNAVPSVTRTNANSLSFTTASLASSTYPVYVVNPDGATAILVPGMRVSGKPNWITTSPLTSWGKSSALSRTLEANSDSAVTYSLAGGSSLPSGLSLAANGLLSGTLTSPPASTTTYNFTVIATDAEGQTTSSAFSINASAGIVATGGTVSNVGEYRIHTFTSSGTFTVTEGTADVEYIVVAGGGGGGASRFAGGGGAGGYRSSVVGENSGGGASAESKLSVSSSPGTYTVTIGAGGAVANKGSNSVFGSITSEGGGKGGTDGTAGFAGGSGGGGHNGAAGGAGTPGQGYAGAAGTAGGDPYATGGGGGAAQTPPRPTNSGSGSVGGNGVQSSISGSAVYYAGGGGGGDRNSVGGAGGLGGGGAGGPSSVAGTANRGGGGGGDGSSGSGSAAGGSGIVIIRYLV